MAIEDVDEYVAADDEVVLVPIVGVDESFEFVWRAEAGDGGRAVGVDAGDLSAHGEKSAATFLIVLASVFICAIDVSLIAAEEPFCAGYLDAAVVDASVAVIRDAEFCFEFEVFRRASTPDEEAVLLEEIVGCNFADKDIVFDAPVLRVTVPVLEGAVEDGLKAFVGVDERMRIDLRAGWWCKWIRLDRGLR